MMKYTNEIDRIKAIFKDAEVFEVDADYEIFHAKIDGVRLVFYPHKTSTGNKHLRVRNGTPKRKNEFLALATILNISMNIPVKNECRNVWWHGDNKEAIKESYPKYQSYWEAAEFFKKLNIAGGL